MSCLRHDSSRGSGSVFLGEGDLDVDELIAGALAVRARIVQSSALNLSKKPARFATRRSAIPVSCGRFQV
jgi:hypothetical protein